MPTRPPSPDPSGASPADAPANPFATMSAGLGAGLDFFQDWIKAAGSALPNLQGATGTGASGMPAWTMPTLDPEELEKRIQDLKTVQFWLEQNARMIAMTIQGLEVQKMTLSTLKGMNVSMDALRESLKVRPEAAAPAPSAPSPASTFGARDTQAPANAGSDDAPAANQAQAEPPAEGAELINPMRWWDTLTQQFTHLASQAAQTVGDSVGESMDRIKQAQAASFTPPPAAEPPSSPPAARREATAPRPEAKPSASKGKTNIPVRKAPRGKPAAS